MDRSIFVCTAFLVLIITLSVGNGIVYHGESESAVTCNNEHQMESANSYTPHGPITITSNADFSSQGWPGGGIIGNPYVIEGLEITADAVCISITGTTVYFEVKDCVISAGGVSSYDGIVLHDVTHGTVQNCTIDLHQNGIYLYNAINCTLTNNTASGNSDCGLYLVTSLSCTLTNNTLVENGVVIRGSISQWFHEVTDNTVNNKPLGYFKNITSMVIDGSQYGQVIIVNCSEVTVKDGIFTDASVGIQLGFCTNCTLTHNTANSNSWDGFYLYALYNCTIKNNAIFSTYWGLYLSYSDNCTLTNNTAYSNTKYGIELGTGSNYNTLYLNRLGNNGESNGRDDGAFNDWDDGVSQGNYWMDYSGTGTYLIPGIAGSVDNYPFVWDDTAPTIDSPIDIEYEEWTQGHLIIWHPTDANPQSYIIYFEGVEWKSGDWTSTSESISISVDGLHPGTYNYTIVVTDMGGNSVTDTVLVTVYQGTATDPTGVTNTTSTTTNTASSSTDDTGQTGLIIVVIGVGIVIVIIVIILGKRNT